MFRSLLAAALCTLPTGALAQDLEGALDRARTLVEAHRYQEVIDLLTPFDDLTEAEARYAVTAEIGRAHFHLGDYAAADAAFRSAVLLRPQRVETALYLQATSYLLGNREQAYAIFREVIASGATDLHLAVSLPGERLFLSDREVWKILDELSRPLEVDPDRGSVLGVELGQSRREVETSLGVDSGGEEDSALSASAGPYLTWVFVFDADDRLGQITLYNEHLYRYTPFRLELAPGLDWQAGPAEATSTLGAPASTATVEDGLVVMSWIRGHVRLGLEFAPPRTPVPPGMDAEKPALRVVRISAQRPVETGTTL
ncbi:MAG: tetratricopeptide repeat protein [Thermoanaerobaculales bacterium]|nr:tetratricopeptide repeat protein [Thermoanaerobaculales bacterium]